MICEVTGGKPDHDGIHIIGTANYEETIKDMIEAYKCSIVILRKNEVGFRYTDRLRAMKRILESNTNVVYKCHPRITILNDRREEIRSSNLSSLEKIDAWMKLESETSSYEWTRYEIYRVEI